MEGVPETDADGLLDFEVDGEEERLADGVAEGLPDTDADGLVDGEPEADADGDGLLDGLLDGDPDGDVEGLPEGDAECDGLLDGDTLPSLTAPAELPRHVPDTSVVTVQPSNAHLFVDCSHRQHQTARIRGYCMIARPLVQLPL